jgi:hypothetical protein
MGNRSDQEVFEAIAELVERGEYLDDLLGPASTGRSGSGMFRGDGESWRQIYRRGSEEHLAAVAEGIVVALPTPIPPATMSAVTEAESLLGHPLPGLLRKLYLEIANGGFGPGYGILGLSGGHTVEPDGTSIDRLHRMRTEGSMPRPSLLPVCDWGCAILSLVDCADPQGRMWGFDPNPVEAIEDAFFPQELNFTDWLSLWIDGTLYQPWALEDPATGEWRGATNDESAAMFDEVDEV